MKRRHDPRRRPATPGRVVVAASLIGFELLGGAELLAEPKAIPPAAKRPVTFAKDIEPLLKETCHKCHGPSRQEAGLRLDRKDDALNGGDSGPAFVVGKSGDSLLIKYVAAIDPDVVMPPEGDRLSDDSIGLLRAWIDQGAKWSD